MAEETRSISCILEKPGLLMVKDFVRGRVDLSPLNEKDPRCLDGIWEK
jgi:hypothetical protein